MARRPKNRRTDSPASRASNHIPSTDIDGEARKATARAAQGRAKAALAGSLWGDAALMGPANPPAGVASSSGIISPAPWWATVSLGQLGYRDEAFATSQERRAPHDTWGYYLDRRLRYDTFAAHYEGNVYRAVHRWAEALKVDRKLYEHIRTIFSPAYRIGEFWAGHIWGGSLDPDAGDGVTKPSALPIIIPDDVPKAMADALRGAIARALADSNWQEVKDIGTRTGAVKGDVGFMVVDDPSREFVSIRVVDPRTIADLRRDSQGNVREYVLQEWRPDPLSDATGPFGRYYCTYTEWARRQGDSVVYTTYRDGVPFDWRVYDDGTPPEDMVGPQWSIDYGFIPFVFHQHRNMGMGWGWSELQPDFGKMYELDDLASKLSDQVRKLVDCPWYFAGAEAGDVTVNYGIDDEGHADDREKVPTIFGPEGSEPKPMVAPLDIAQVSAHIQSILADLERDHPELQADDVGASSSGEARRVAREKVEAMVLQRRAGYDAALVRIIQMAISIGAKRNATPGMPGRDAYFGYEAFDEESYDRGELDFSIGDRPVFAVNVMDKLAEAAQRSAVYKTLVDGGMPMSVAMELAGYPQETIDEAKDEAAAAADDAVKRAVKQQAGMFAAGGGDALHGTAGGDIGNGNRGRSQGGPNGVSSDDQSNGDQVEKPPGLSQ